LKYFLSFRISEQFPLTLKNRVCPEIFQVGGLFPPLPRTPMLTISGKPQCGLLTETVNPNIDFHQGCSGQHFVALLNFRSGIVVCHPAMKTDV